MDHFYCSAGYCYYLLAILLVRLATSELASSTVVQLNLSYTIDEELSEGTLIADLVKDANLARDLTTLTDIKFKLISQPPFDLFLDDKSGLIINRGRIDREELCPLRKDLFPQHHKFQTHHPASSLQHIQSSFSSFSAEHFCQFRLDVVITPMTFFRTIRVTINVLDINDNRPKFLPASKHLEILESTQPGTSYILAPAIDEDLQPFSISRYELEERSLSNVKKRFTDRLDVTANHFQINSTRKDDGSSELKLVLIKTLDRETQDRLLLVVTAFDGGDPPLSGFLEIFVLIRDANDNNPLFEYEVYQVTAPENITEGSIVARVRAVDPDLDENGRVEYQLNDVTKDKYGHIFEVDRHSGDVAVVGSLDYEQTSIYRLIVAAYDNGSPAKRTSEVAVVVKVLDINDNKPIIHVNALQTAEGDTATILENLETDSFIAHVVVTDLDSEWNGQFNCSLNQSSHFRLKQTTTDGEYQILTKTVLDREERTKYFLKLTCKDHGYPSLTSHELVKIQVTDANDNLPLFQRNEYRVELLENNDIKNINLVQVAAKDDDSAGNNSRIQYSLLSPGQDHKSNDGGSKLHLEYFTVDSNSGMVNVVKPVDREAIPEFRFPLFACDQGTPQMCSQTRIVVIILDSNDEAPQFPVQTFSFSVEENSPSGTEVGIITARDNDLPPHDQFLFSIRASTFLSTSSTKSLVNNPNCQHGAGSKNCGNSAITTSSSTTALFLLDSETGQLVSNSVLDRETNDVHHFLIEAKDINDNRLTSTASVYVYVLDQNDNDPVWLEPKWNRESVTEKNNTTGNQNKTNYLPTVILPLYRHSKPGTIVTRFKVSDLDAGQNAQIYYKLDFDQSKHHELFRVDNRTGALIVASALKRLPANATVALVATAVDRGVPPRSSSIRIMIELLDTYRFGDHISSIAVDSRQDYFDESLRKHKDEYDQDALMFSLESIEAIVLASTCVSVFVIVTILLVVAVCLLVQNKKRRKKLEKEKQSHRQQQTHNHNYNANHKQHHQHRTKNNESFTTFRPLTFDGDANPRSNSRLNNLSTSEAQVYNCHRENHQAQDTFIGGSNSSFIPSKNCVSPRRNPAEMLLSDFDSGSLTSPETVKYPCAATACALDYSHYRHLNGGSPFGSHTEKAAPKVDYCAAFAVSGGGVLFGERNSPDETLRKSNTVARMTAKSTFATHLAH